MNALYDLYMPLVEQRHREATDARYYRLHHDFETYSEIDVTDVGSDRYSRDPTTEVLMCGYAVNDDPIQQWVPAEDQPIPADLVEMIRDPWCLKYAWNKPFEWHIWTHVLGIETPHRAWRDPMVMAYNCSLPGALDKCGLAMKLPPEFLKMSGGTLLINKFSKPRKPTKNKPYTRTFWWMDEEEWNRYKLYNHDDVQAERAIYKRLLPYDLRPEDWEDWFIDQEINQDGIPINMNLVRNAQRVYRELLGWMHAEMTEVTGLGNPNSTAQLLPWLRQYGYMFEDCKKGHIARAIVRCEERLAGGDWIERTIGDDGELIEVERPLSDVRLLHKVLVLRSEAASTSPTKYDAIARSATGSDEEGWVVRNGLQFGGAQRTLRWAGRLFQVHNLPKPAKSLEKVMPMVARHLETLDAESLSLIYPKPMEVLTAGIRPCAQAPEGEMLGDADLNAIENRVLGWMAGDHRILEVFEQGRDPYIAFATYMFGETYDALWNEYKVEGKGAKRTISKPGVLGCGYMLGAGEERTNSQTGEVEGTGLLGYAWNMGITEFTKEQSATSVRVFRETYEDVKQFWYDFERAAKKCISTGKPVEHRMFRFDRKGPFLRMILPSGRPIHYCRPMIEQVKAPWGDLKDTITYEGPNDKNQWVRLTTHPGKLTENADQALARDILAHGIRLAKKEGLRVRIHVHDQQIITSLEHRAQDDLAVLQQCMAVVPKWAKYGNLVLPLASNGFVSKIFIKD